MNVCFFGQNSSFLGKSSILGKAPRGRRYDFVGVVDKPLIGDSIQRGDWIYAAAYGAWIIFLVVCCKHGTPRSVSNKLSGNAANKSCPAEKPRLKFNRAQGNQNAKPLVFMELSHLAPR